MIKRIILIILFFLVNEFSAIAQEHFSVLSPIEQNTKICSYLKKKKIISSNFCVNEDDIGFKIDIKTNSNNEKSYNIYFSDFIKSNVSKKQFEGFLEKKANSLNGNYIPTYSNKKLYIVNKPVIIENEYFILIVKIEKSTKDMFLVHLRINNLNDFSIINMSGIW